MKLSAKKLIEKYIDEDITVHNELNPKIWDSNNELLPDVKDKILDIVQEFVIEVQKIGAQINPVDVRIVGSNANYNYSDESDLDLHIIVDPKDDCDKKHLQIIYDIYRNAFNNSYDIYINGVNTEIYVEKYNEAPTSNGIYSLSDGWIVQPDKYTPPEIDQKQVNEIVQAWVKEFKNIVSDIQMKESLQKQLIFEFFTAKDKLKQVEDLISTVYKYRSEGLAEDGEFSVKNMAFKEFRRQGYLQKLRDLKNKYQGELLSS